jgi:glycosyltransferase involved in cell wall biosynthesis
MSTQLQPLKTGDSSTFLSGASREPRILFLSQLYPPVFGGGGVFLSNIRRILSRQGFETEVVAGNRGIAGDVEPRVSRIPTPGGERLHRMGSYSFALLSPAVLLAHARRYDIIHTMGNGHYVYASILMARLLGKKVVIASVQNRKDDPGGILQQRFGRIKNWLFSRADRFICLNSLQVRTYGDAGYPAQKIRLIRNGIDTSRCFPCDSPQTKAALRAKLGLPPEGFVLVSIGAIIHRKGMDLLAQAWSRFRVEGGHGTLVLVGPQSSRDHGSGVDDDFVGDLKEILARNNAAESVIFTGKVGNVPEYLRAADAFALMSRGEGFPLALLEAMSSGLPFLMWDLPDYGGYTLTDQVHGFLVPPFDTHLLAQRLATLANSPEARARMGAEARRLAVDLDIECSAAEHIKVYRELVAP